MDLISVLVKQYLAKKTTYFVSLFIQPNGEVSIHCIFPEVLQRYWHTAELQMCLLNSPLWFFFITILFLLEGEEGRFHQICLAHSLFCLYPGPKVGMNVRIKLAE